MKSLMFGLAGCIGLVGCGDADPCASTRDIAESPSALELTSGEHTAGWGRADCFQCHQAFLIHQNDCTLVADVDSAAIAALIDPSDTTTCISCHGTNGVPEWAGLDDSGEAR